MEELRELKERLHAQRPAPWAELPDLALYMDQLISYMPRQLIRYEDGDVLTAAMVNNYIKDGLLPRAEGKRYGREHLAWLTTICALKPVLSMREMGTLFGAKGEEDADPEGWYRFFLEHLDRSMETVAQRLDVDEEDAALPALALRLALDSYASKLACQRVLALLQERQPDANEDKKKRKESHHE